MTTTILISLLNLQHKSDNKRIANNKQTQLVIPTTTSVSGQWPELEQLPAEREREREREREKEKKKGRKKKRKKKRKRKRKKEK